MLLVRWQNLSGAMEMLGQRRHFDLLNGRERFDAYTPGQTPLPFLAGGADPALARETVSASERPDRSQPRGPDASPEGARPPRAGPRRPGAESSFLDHSL
jgi:hypothetical protein